MNEPTQAELIDTFAYRDGNLYWKVYKGSRAKIGDLAGTLRVDGYRRVQINKEMCYVHRLIFKYHYGYAPKYLDHIDRNPSNNNILNLREATNGQNVMNSEKHKFLRGKLTSSIYKGVVWSKHAKKWRAYITINKRQKHLGYYTSDIEAALAYDRAAIELDGEYALTNKSLGLLP